MDAKRQCWNGRVRELCASRKNEVSAALAIELECYPYEDDGVEEVKKKQVSKDEIIRKARNHNRFSFLVAEDAQGIAGTMVARKDFDQHHYSIESLMVTSSKRRQRVASSLLRHLKIKAKEQGFSIIIHIEETFLLDGYWRLLVWCNKFQVATVGPKEPLIVDQVNEVNVYELFWSPYGNDSISPEQTTALIKSARDAR